MSAQQLSLVPGSKVVLKNQQTKQQRQGAQAGHWSYLKENPMAKAGTI